MACDKELAPLLKYSPPADLVEFVQSEWGIKEANDMAAKHAYMVETIRAVCFQTLDLFCLQAPVDNGGWWQINLSDDKPPSHQGAFAGSSCDGHIQVLQTKHSPDPQFSFSEVLKPFVSRMSYKSNDLFVGPY